MAMPYHNYVDQVYSKYLYAYGKATDAMFDQAMASMTYDGGDDHAALGYLIDSVFHIGEYMPYALTHRGGTPRGFYLADALRALWEYDNEPAGELTMDAILNTMLVADPDEVMRFVGLVDAYRQSIWNQPFNQEMYAALARGFMEWE